MPGTLSASDVKRLMEDPSVETRAETAEKIASQFEAGELSEKERGLAYEIFKVMVQDVEERVRSALSNNLKNAPNLPRDLAVTMAKDVSDSVALPIIQFSEALDDTDLIEIIRTQSVDRQVAVASRSNVSEGVADTLVDEGDRKAVVALVSNKETTLSEKTLDKVVGTYGDDIEVQDPLVHRPKLPVTIAEKLVAHVSDNLREYLVTHHELPEQAATDIILQVRERTTIGLVSNGAEEQDVEKLVAQIHKNGRLTPSIILRALCVGDMSFFEASLAVMSKVPLNNARVLIHDEGELGFKSLFKKAGMPDALFPAFRTALDTALGAEAERSDADIETQMRRMLERVLTVHENVIDEYGIENVDYLLSKFNTLADAHASGDDGK